MHTQWYGNQPAKPTLQERLHRYYWLRGFFLGIATGAAIIGIPTIAILAYRDYPRYLPPNMQQPQD